jgi:hypothetical protein
VGTYTAAALAAEVPSTGEARAQVTPDRSENEPEWTMSTEAYGPSRRRGSAQGAVKPEARISGRGHQLK